MTKKTSKKLGLKRESIRTLSETELKAANGGLWLGGTFYSAGCVGWSTIVESNSAYNPSING